MANMPFLIWMLGWPLMIDVCHYLSYLQGDKYEVGSLFEAIIMIGWYIGIAVLLYEKKKPPSSIDDEGRL
ncbi:MAG: hypothetical protein KAX30_04390 [Candidatus Atribacteria bacterium]|nr:hypothetical protein [Candidatus Atribacteria bacterium]